MKVMLDTNVLISAFIFGGRPKEAIGRLLLSGHDIYVSEYVDQEFKYQKHRKGAWSSKL